MEIKLRTKTPVELALEILPELKKRLEDEAMDEIGQVEIVFLLLQLVAGPGVALGMMGALLHMQKWK